MEYFKLHSNGNNEQLKDGAVDLLRDKEKVTCFNPSENRSEKTRFHCLICNTSLHGHFELIKHIDMSKHKRKNNDHVNRIRTLEKIKPLNKKCDELLTGFMKETLSKIPVISNDITERTEILQRLHNLVEKKGVKGISFQLCGSSVTRIGFENAGVDIAVNFDIEQLQKIDSKMNSTNCVYVYLFRLLGSQENKEQYSDVKEFFYMKYPKIVFKDIKSGLICTISTVHYFSVSTSDLILKYLKLDERVKELSLLFRYWAQICSLDKQENGGIPPAAFVVMVIHYLQQVSPPVVPIIHIENASVPENLPDGLIDKNIEAKYTVFVKDLSSWKSKNKDSIGKLFLGLFRYYLISFFMKAMVVTIRQKGVLSRFHRGFGSTRIAVEDPFILRDSITVVVTSQKVMNYFMKSLERTYRYFAVGNVDDKKTGITKVSKETRSTSPDVIVEDVDSNKDQDDISSNDSIDNSDHSNDEDEFIDEKDDDDDVGIVIEFRDDEQENNDITSNKTLSENNIKEATEGKSDDLQEAACQIESKEIENKCPGKIKTDVQSLSDEELAKLLEKVSISDDIVSSLEISAVANETLGVSNETSAVSNETSAVSSETHAVSNETSAVSNATPAVSNERSAVSNETPTVSNATPAVSNETSAVSSETHAVSNETPTVSNETPAVSNKTPTVSNETPAISNETSAVSNERSAISNGTPTVSNETPAVSNEWSAISNETPTVSNATPAVSNERSTVSNETPTVSNETPAVSNEGSAISNETPTISNETAAVSNETPAVSNETPAVSNETPTVLNETSAVLNETPTLLNDSSAILSERTTPSNAVSNEVTTAEKSKATVFNERSKDTTIDSQSNHTNLIPKRFSFSKQNFAPNSEIVDVCLFCKSEGHIFLRCPQKTIRYEKLKPLKDENFVNILGAVCQRVLTRCALSYDDLKKRAALKQYIETHLQRTFRHDCRLDLFGSSINGFASANADMDICLRFDSDIMPADLDQGRTVGAVEKALKLEKQVIKNIKSIKGAKVPIVKFEIDGIDADISLYNCLGLYNSNLVCTYARIDPRVQMLGFCIKAFVKLCDIGDASRGSLSSYAYILMTIYYLQHTTPPVIPVLQELYDKTKSKPQRMVENWNTWFYEPIENLPSVWNDFGKNQQIIGELLLGFFRFYIEKFDYYGHVISIRTSDVVLKHEKGWSKSLIAIEDPFKLDHNLGSAITNNMFEFIITCFKQARKRFGEAPDGYPQDPVQYFFDGKFLTKDNYAPIGRNCFNCRKIGHQANNCPEKEKDSKRETRNQRCRICRSINHFAKDCPKNKQQDAQTNRETATVEQNSHQKQQDVQKSTTPKNMQQNSHAVQNNGTPKHSQQEYAGNKKSKFVTPKKQLQMLDTGSVGQEGRTRRKNEQQTSTVKHLFTSPNLQKNSPQKPMKNVLTLSEVESPNRRDMRGHKNHNVDVYHPPPHLFQDRNELASFKGVDEYMDHHKARTPSNSFRGGKQNYRGRGKQHHGQQYNHQGNFRQVQGETSHHDYYRASSPPKRFSSNRSKGAGYYEEDFPTLHSTVSPPNQPTDHHRHFKKNDRQFGDAPANNRRNWRSKPKSDVPHQHDK